MYVLIRLVWIIFERFPIFVFHRTVDESVYTKKLVQILCILIPSMCWQTSFLLRHLMTVLVTLSYRFQIRLPENSAVLEQLLRNGRINKCFMI